MRISLQINIDGLPLWRSSRTDTSEFMVSLHCAVGKSASLSSYLRPLIDELNDLLVNGLHHLGQRFEIEIASFCYDAPARALIKQIKGHTGYSACEKCEVYGTRFEKRTTFEELTAPLRYELNDFQHLKNDHIVISKYQHSYFNDSFQNRRII